MKKLFTAIVVVTICISSVTAQNKISLPRSTPEEQGVSVTAINTFLDSIAKSKHEFQSFMLVGIHQGLAPVLDVTRDYRWGRTEETIGEDPYLVGVVGTAYVRGLQRSGVQATLQQFAAYAASRAG